MILIKKIIRFINKCCKEPQKIKIFLLQIILYRVLPNKNNLNNCKKFLPNFFWLDNLIHFRNFILAHHRIPLNNNWFNDEVYKTMTTKEIVNPLRVFTTDKEFVKIFIKSIVGDKYNVPTIAVLKKIREIDNFNFKEGLIVKPTHCSAMYHYIKKNDNTDEIKKIFKSWLNINYYDHVKERHYKNLEPKVIVEPVLFKDYNIRDYKFHCFDGQVKFIVVDFDRRTKIHTRKHYNKNWKDLKFSLEKPHSNNSLEKPQCLDEMILVAEKISSKFMGIIRVDMYTNNNKCFVGELTHVHGASTERFFPSEAEPRISKSFFSETTPN